MATTTSELRHMTSNPSITLSTPAQHSPATTTHTSTVSPARAKPQPLMTVSTARGPSNSRPSSIPSSPTSVHSSSSAIFERDIEPLSLTTSPQKPRAVDPHRTSRARSHEPLDSGVPTVLASAVSALAISPATAAVSGSPPLNRTEHPEDISVISPAPGGPNSSLFMSGMTSPALSLSRSPSPPASISNTAVASPSSPTSRPVVFERQSTGPLPPGAFPSATSRSGTLDSSFAETGESYPEATEDIPRARPKRSVGSLTSAANEEGGIGHANKRLSFVSYHDLLLSTPTNTTSLAALTSAATVELPPHHLSSVSGQTSPTRTLAGAVGWGKDDGGEWEREGLGKGLEERLEEVLNAEARAIEAGK